MSCPTSWKSVRHWSVSRGEGNAQPGHLDGQGARRADSVGGTGQGVGGTKYGLKMTVKPTESGCDFTVKIDLGGRPLFGPIGATAARLGQGRYRALDREVRRALHLSRRAGAKFQSCSGPVDRLADMSVKPIPQGYTSLTPFLCIDGALPRSTSIQGVRRQGHRPNGRTRRTVAHAELDSVTDDCSCRTLTRLQDRRARPEGGGTHSIALYCQTPTASSPGPRRPVRRSVNPRRRSSPATGSRRSSIRSASAGR